MQIDENYCASVSLENFVAKATTSTPGQREATHYIVGDKMSELKMGVWECTPGRFTVSRTNTEVVKILSGRVTLHDKNGQSVSHGPGSVFEVRTGWTGEWDVHETVRKIFMVFPL